MPRAQKGHRFGGREKGSRNKTTIERERLAAEIAQRTVMDARAGGRKLAKEQMQEFLPVLAGMTAYYQPTFPGMAQQNPHGNAKEFERWLGHFVMLARSLAPYESATFRAIDLRAVLPQNQGADPMDVMRSLLEEIDDDTRRVRQERTQQQIEVLPSVERKRA